MTIMDKLDDLVTEIQRRGIPATMDPRNLEVPGALVDLDRIGTDNMLCGDTTATATVWLLVPDHDHPSAVAALLDRYHRLKDLTDGAETADLVLPDLPPLPALKLNPIQLED